MAEIKKKSVLLNKVGRGVFLLIGWLILLASISACATSASGASGVRIAGARDVLPLANGIQEGFKQATGFDLILNPSLASLEDLKAGQADAALLGWEPSQAELQGLHVTPVAYDAVCFLIGSHAYVGGMTRPDPATMNGVVNPQLKMDPFQNLTMEDVRNYLANKLQLNQDHWFTGKPLFSYQDYSDANGQPETDPANPNYVLGMWVWNSIDLLGENWQPGKFDTQTFLLQKMGIPTSVFDNSKVSYNSFYDSEEEMISAHFKINEKLKEPVSDQGFDFYVFPASRRVTLRAIQYKFALNALSIEGINPLDNPRAIYDGSYPFSRKIYLVTAVPPTPETQKLIDFLLSAEGQKLIQQAYFLPLPSGQN